jgi:RNase H-like domain found in reverse transcriptase/Reverse transcriptase (RNA-dependent DNA polymerase)
VFSLVDAKCAFWLCELDYESSMLTTFESPFGRFRWNRLPYGLSPSPEIFARKFQDALTGLQGVVCIADDVLVYGQGTTVDEARVDHDNNLKSLLERCRQENIKLNRDKMKINCPSVRFMGHELTQTGIKPDIRKIDAINQMPPPVDKAGVSRLIGMATFLARYTKDFSTVTAPLRELLKTENEFVWNDTHQMSLDALKKILTAQPVLQYYDPKKPLTVQCDSSQSGLGACLLQDGKVVEYASRSLSSAEVMYAQIEKELLAICFALERWRTFCYSRFVTVETDHLPLLAIMKKALAAAPKRLQRSCVCRHIRSN